MTTNPKPSQAVQLRAFDAALDVNRDHIDARLQARTRYTPVEWTVHRPDLKRVLRGHPAE